MNRYKRNVAESSRAAFVVTPTHSYMLLYSYSCVLSVTFHLSPLRSQILSAEMRLFSLLPLCI